MMTSVARHPITIAMSANATGKSHGSARVALWFFLTRPEAQVYLSCAPPEANLTRILLAEVFSVVHKHPELFEGMTITRMGISRSPKSFLTGTSIPLSGTPQQREAKFSGKHAPNLLFLFDEGDAVPDECFTGAESCLSGGEGRMLIMFNPRAEQGFAYRAIREKRASVVHLSAFSHINVVTGKEIIPGAVSRSITVRRINEWCRPLSSGEMPDSECFELPGFLSGAVAMSQGGEPYPSLSPGYYKIVEPQFSYMTLGKYPAQGSTALISRAWIDAARSRYDQYIAAHGERPPLYSQAIVGFDIGEYGSDASVLCFRYGTLVLPLIAWGGMDILTSADKAAAECRKRNVSAVNADGTGVGSGCAPALQRQGIAAVPVKVASSPTARTELGEFHILLDQLWWSVREWLRTDQAMLPPDELLLEELIIPTYEVVNGKIRVMKKSAMRELLTRSPDRADALCLTFAPQGFFSNCDLF